MAASGVRVGVSTFYRWLDSGMIPAQRVGSRWFVQEAEIDRLVLAIREHKDVLAFRYATRRGGQAL